MSSNQSDLKCPECNSQKIALLMRNECLDCEESWNHDCAWIRKLQEKLQIYEQALKELQSECGYASPWWIKIEKIINPTNHVLKDNDRGDGWD